MRPLILGLCGFLAACAQQYTETRLAPGAPLPVNEARFAEPPALLYEAFRESCDGPGDSYATLGRSGARCRTVPPPDVAAGLLLRYDGALEIPYIVLERQTRREADGYVVALSYFATVPQPSGTDQRVYLRSRDIDATFAALFTAFGGEPL